MELQILKLNFFFYTVTGMWRPLHWTSKRSKILYNVYTVIAIYLLVYIFLTHFMYIIFVVKSLSQLCMCAFFFLALVNLLVKGLAIVIHRDKFINLIEIIQGEPCKPCDEDEINIQITYDRAIRSYSMPYIILCTMSLVNCIGSGILFMLNGVIPYGFAWVPWDCSSNFIFIITCLQEIASTSIGIFINVATETTMLGFCLQICAQFEILKHRMDKTIKQTRVKGSFASSLNNTTNKTSRLSEYISFHLRIIRLAKTVNDVFNQVVFAQFSTSILILCTLGYYMSSDSKRLEDMITFTAYFFCTFLQIFYYCWSGNEVTLKSAEFSQEIYNMDWTFLKNSEQKNLLIIMKLNTRPIKLTSSFLVTLNLESYTNLLKASFSIFNLLQQF